MKTSRKTVETVFAYFVEALSGKVAQSYNEVGAYRLDYNSVYGGYNIERICNSSGGVSNPFGTRRSSASEMVQKMNFAMEVMREIKAVA